MNSLILDENACTTNKGIVEFKPSYLIFQALPKESKHGTSDREKIKLHILWNFVD